MTLDMNDPFAGIDQCMEHPQAMNPDHAACVAEFDNKNAVLQEINDGIAKDLKMLSRQDQHMPANLPFEVRLELLIETILQDRQRLHFEVETARRLSAIIQAAKKENVRGGIVMPNGNPGKLHVARG